MGIDIGAPVGTPIRAFTDGKIHSFAYEEEEGGYGNLIITQHNVKFPMMPNTSGQEKKKQYGFCVDIILE